MSFKVANGVVAAWMVSTASIGLAAGIPGYVPFGTPTFIGTGCNKNTVAFQAGEDAFTLLFTEAYEVWAGQGAKARDMVKNCVVSMPINVPAGYQVAIETIDYNGFVDATEGGQASFLSWYVLTGKGFADTGTSKQSVFKGPIFDEDGFPGKTWQRRDVSSTKKPEKRWSRCGGKHNLVLASHMIATARKGGNALLKLDATDGVASLRYGTTWRACKG
jgi:hypothetical protein